FTDDSAGLAEYTDVVVDAIGDRADLILVAQSMGGFTAPLVCDRKPVDMIVLLNAMIAAPGESPGEWWTNTGHEEAKRALDEAEGRSTDGDFDPLTIFLHDVPKELWAESEKHSGPQSGTPFAKPWPLDAWPSIPTKVLIGRDDRFFPAEFQRRVAKERLGIAADEMPGGHLVALSRPKELAERLEKFRSA
ncbi:MAG TPA: alpha/beta hydrolase, partial [Actinomycetota bacterium]|nr:alpha/beta hydrolase [Actinomycetota bacterium]